MANGLVLVIEDDEWVARLLAVAVREAGFEAAVCTTAAEGLEAAVSQTPDCIVCDADLPDHDGFWVAQNVRTHHSKVSVTPFLFLSGLDDQESRLQGFHVGADVYMTKPFRVDEVVAQVSALVQMAKRLRERRDTFLSIPPQEASAIEGDLAQMSVATVLTVLEMERRSGTFEVVSKKRRAQVELAAGCVIGGAIGGTSQETLDVLRAMLSWAVGRFSFAPKEPSGEPVSGPSVGSLLMEACRLNDEAAAGASIPPSRRDPGTARFSAPSLGGPLSNLLDLTPPRKATPPPPQAGASAPEEVVPKAPPTPSPKAPGKVASDAPAPAAASDRASGSRGSRPELEVSVEEVDSVELQSVPPSVDDGWGEPEPEGAEPPKKAPPPVPKKPAGAKASLPPPARAATGAPQAAKGRSHRPGTKPGAIKPVIPKPVVTPPADKKTKG